MVEEHPKEKEKSNLSKLNIWEQIGIISTVVAVIGTLIFSVWDKWDYKKQIAKTTYDKLYSDVSQGRYSGIKLVKAINEIYEHGDDLTGMNLSRKWLRRTILKEKNLYAINLDYSDLQGADLRKVNLENANLVGANLKKVNLEDANLVAANLWRADLRGANLKGADLREAFFFEADLRETLGLTIQQLFFVKNLYNVRLDDDFMKLMEQENLSLLYQKPDSMDIDMLLNR